MPQPRIEASEADAAVDGPAMRDTDGAAAAAPVLAAGWCCSVGVTWTLELRELDPGTALGTLVDWISSGVPTSQPEPDEALAAELLADRGLHLYRDSAAGPCTHSRHSIGYVCSDAEVIAQARRARLLPLRFWCHGRSPEDIPGGAHLSPVPCTQPAMARRWHAIRRAAG